MVNCPVCDAAMDVEEDELDEGDEFTCEECGAEVAVVGTDPLEIEPLSDADEEEDDDDDCCDCDQRSDHWAPFPWGLLILRRERHRSFRAADVDHERLVEALDDHVLTDADRLSVRPRLPELAADEDEAGRVERLADHADLADELLLAGDRPPAPGFRWRERGPMGNSGSPMTAPALPVTEALRQIFGYSGFRPLQEEIVRDVLAGRDVLALLPTGGGKSLCYQLPACVASGLTVVVSPLIALMKDQVDGLAQAGVPATFLNSSLMQKKEATLQDGDIVSFGEVQFWYLLTDTLHAKLSGRGTTGSW